jgi:hypothetical protein
MAAGKFEVCASVGASVDMENSAKPNFVKGFALELIPDDG